MENKKNSWENEGVPQGTDKIEYVKARWRPLKRMAQK